MKILILYTNKNNKKNSTNFKEIDLTDLELIGSKHDPIHEFIKFPSMKINDKTILEWFEEKGISYWWFVYQTIFPKYKNGIQFIDQFLIYLEKYHPEKLILCGCFDKLDIIQQICHLKNIKLIKSKQKYLTFLLTKYFKSLVKKRMYKKITMRKQKKRLSCFGINKTFSAPKNSIIITSAGVYRRNLINFETGQIQNREFMIQPFLDLFKKNKIPVLCFDFDYTFRGELKFLKERIQTEDNWAPVEVLLSNPKSKSVKKSISNLTESIKALIESKPEKKFLHKNIKLWEYLKPVFKELTYEPYLPTYVHLIDSVRKLFVEIKPNKIIQVYETGPFAKTFEVVAKEMNIKTFGIQHGVIYPGNPDYMHKELRTQDFSLGNPIPDLTLVFGNYYKQILIESGNYPKNSIDVIGNPTFYNIEQIKKILNKNSILKKNNIINDNKVVLIALSSRIANDPKNIHDSMFLDLLYKEFKNEKDLTFLIRPHPSDSLNFKKFIEENYFATNFVVSKNNIFEDIFISDLVVTVGSSVGVDATIFEKPVFYLDISNKYLNVESIQEKSIEYGVAKLYSKDEMIQNIRLIKKDITWKIDQSKKQKEFLLQFFNYPKNVDLMKLINS